MEAATGMLDKVEAIAKSVPAVDNKGSRFGNPAFKTFYDQVTEVEFGDNRLPHVNGDKVSAGLHASLPRLPEESIPEVSGYFNESWGNRTRVDYGSGMELNFLCWM